MALLKKKRKNQFPHIGSAQKKKAMAFGTPYVANYSQDKDLYKALGIPASESKILIVLESKKVAQKQSIDAELERLGGSILSKQEAEANKPYQYPFPVKQASQQKVLKKIKNDTLKINEQALADIIGCGKRTVSSVINGKTTFTNKGFKDRLNQLVKITNLLLGLIEEEELPKWIKRKLKDIDNKTPLELLTEGQAEELYVWAYAELEGRYR